MPRREEGFSIIELLMIALVVAVVVVIGVRTFIVPQAKADVASKKSMVETSAAKLAQWGSQQGGFQGFSSDVAKRIADEVPTWTQMASEEEEPPPGETGWYTDENQSPPGPARSLLIRTCVPWFEAGGNVCLAQRLNPYDPNTPVERIVSCFSCARPVYGSEQSKSDPSAWPQLPGRDAG